VQGPTRFLSARQRGVALVEVVVALVIMASVAASIMSWAVQLARNQERLSDAVLLASITDTLPALLRSGEALEPQGANIVREGRTFRVRVSGREVIAESLRSSVFGVELPAERLVAYTLSVESEEGRLLRQKQQVLLAVTEAQ